MIHITSTIHAHPDYKKKFHLYADSSGIAFSVLFVQHDDRNKFKVIEYVSRVLNKAETNQFHAQKEDLTENWSVHFQHLIHGYTIHPNI